MIFFLSAMFAAYVIFVLFVMAKIVNSLKFACVIGRENNQMLKKIMTHLEIEDDKEDKEG